ncbi:MAG: hypothetical protein FJ335_11250, partial [Sphingomonadales bacterium]|nr:hypothetical protein [Sphingomonadales bacterium]
MSGVARAIGTIASIAAMIPGPHQPIAAAVAIAASVTAQVTAKKPVNERQGLQLSFKIDPNSPIYYPIGRTAVGGVVVHRETYGTDNHYQTYFVDLGLGPIQAIETFLADRAPIAFAGTNAIGYYSRWMWQDRQIGALPEVQALGHGVTAPPYGSIPAQVPGWSGAHKLSGHAAASWTMLFDTKARRYAQGEPQPGWIVQGALVWDPRLDSTYPGGSGSCRRDDPATWVYSETPALHGLKWRLGIYQNGKRIMGVGAPIDLIDVARIVEA